MAETNISTSNALRKQAWAAKLHRATQKEAFFTNLFGEDAANIVQVKTDVEKDQGDKINFGLITRLAGNWIEDDAILEGNEEALSTFDFNVVLKQFRTAVRDNGEMSRKRFAYDLPTEMETALRTAGAEKIDQLCFDEIGVGSGASVTTPTQVAYPTATAATYASTATAATAKAGLHATNSKLTLDFIAYCKMVAKTGLVGTTDRVFEPLRPVMIEGKQFYVMLVAPSALLDLKLTSDFKNAMQYAHERGEDNPLFKGATAIWDGVIILEHENCEKRTDGGGASVAWSKGVMMGAQALCWAWGRRPEIVEKHFDYENKLGMAYSFVAKPAKSKFNSIDYGSLGVYTARVN